MSAKLQSVLIPKNKTLAEVNAILRKKNYKLTFRRKKPIIEGDYWHCRQSDPKKGAKIKYFTKEGKNKIKYVFFLVKSINKRT